MPRRCDGEHRCGGSLAETLVVVGLDAPSLEPSPILGEFEKALERVYKHEWEAAAQALRGLITRYPEEGDVLDRVRSYLVVCERNLVKASGPPRTGEDD